MNGYVLRLREAISVVLFDFHYVTQGFKEGRDQKRVQQHYFQYKIVTALVHKVLCFPKHILKEWVIRKIQNHKPKSPSSNSSICKDNLEGPLADSLRVMLLTALGVG